MKAKSPYPGLGLLPQHAKQLRASGISPHVAKARGYRSITKLAKLRGLGFSEAQCREPGLLIPIWDVRAKIATYQFRPDAPRVDKGGKPVKYENVVGSRLVLDVPPAAHKWLGDPKRPLFITEGARKVDAAVSRDLCCISLLGVWGWRGTNNQGGKVTLADWEQVALNGRGAYIAFDSDVMTKPEVEAALGRLKTFLESKGANVRLIYLPHGPKGEKQGLDDYLAAGHTVKELYSLASDEIKARLRINAADLDLPKVSETAWEALREANDPPFLFRYGGLPAQIEKDDHGAAVVREITQDRLRYHLARAANWYSGRKEKKSALPPLHVVRDMLATPNPPLPILTRIVETPVFGRKGRLQEMPGYHRGSRTYYAPGRRLDIPKVPIKPTKADVQRARRLIVEDLFGDFPFVGPAECAHAVALLLLPFVRDLIEGPTPLHLIEKPTPGTGGTLLADVVIRIVTGRPAAAMTEGRDEDEWRKRITSKLMTGPTVLLIDNLRRRLESAAVSAAMTAETWEDRLLGHTQQVRAPVRCAWVATGNNPSLAGDIARRTIRIRLDAKIDRPWLRKGFRHPNLRGWVARHRGELVWAALTLIRAWLKKGKPQSQKPLGMYERWVGVMGGILNVAGIPGFLENLEEFYEESDAEGAAWRTFVAAWWARFRDRKVGVSDLYPLVNPQQRHGDPIDLPIGEGTDRSQKTRLGKLLVGMRDRQFDGFRIVKAGVRGRAQTWRLVRGKGPRVNTGGRFTRRSPRESA